MRHEKQRSDNIESLIKVQDLRLKRLEQQYLNKRRERDQAREEFEARQASICLLKEKRSALFRFLEKPDEETRPVSHLRVHNSRYWVDYDLEKDEYYLEMEREALEAAQQAMDAARKDWLRARNRQEGMHSLQEAQRRKLSLGMEMQVELENEEAHYQQQEKT